MRIKLAIVLSIILTVSVKGQELPQVIPPSPEAISMIQSGNTHVNYYTGQPGMTIPIHTISIGGYALPISLNYNGFQGINVESIAPWVGLGWSLSAGGSVSRVIRDLPDDETIKGDGFLTVPHPDMLDNVGLEGYIKGSKDKEPDKFFYNINGLSGSFFFNKEGEVVEKVKSNVKIEFWRNSEIDSFRISDENGIKYLFSQKEKTLAQPQGKSVSDVPNAVSSWYIDKIMDVNGNELMSFKYYTLDDLRHSTFSYQSLRYDFAQFQESVDVSYTWHTTSAKRIKEINYSGGKVKFNISDSTRIDYLNDRYLDNIEVRESDTTQLGKRLQFDYSYFGQDGTYPIDHQPSYPIGSYTALRIGDYFKRLKLDQVQEWSKESNSIPPYVFEYYGGNLPHRYSYAQDHWGFYNGQDDNISPEPKYKVSFFSRSNISGTWEPVETLRFLGSANREANSHFAKFGVLKKVVYPTGGTTEFQHEGNTVTSDELLNDESTEFLDVLLNNTRSVDIDVDLIRDPFTLLRVSGNIPEQECPISGGIYNSLTDDLVKSIYLTFKGDGGVLGYDTTVYLTAGSYYAKFQFQPNNGCSYTGIQDKIDLSYTKEVFKESKSVGGLRVKSIADHDGISSANDVVRHFYYGEDGELGGTTGEIVTVPKYAYQKVSFVHSSGDWSAQPHVDGLIRSLRPTYPLMTTSGSFVGYSKVTVVKGDKQITGKTVYEYTSPSEYPNITDGYYNEPLQQEDMFETAVGNLSIYPFPETDDRDFLRGLLKKQTNYSWNGSSYDKVAEVENTYDLSFNLPIRNGQINPIQPEGYSFVKGVKIFVHPGQTVDPKTLDFKWYNIYAGRLDLVQSVNKQFGSVNDSLEVITNYYRDDLFTEPGYYNVSRVTSLGSDGALSETQSTFVYDNPSWLDPAIKAALEARNMSGSALEQKSFKGGTQLSVMRNILGIFNTDQLYPSEVEVAKGEEPLESRVTYHSYDIKGNPTEVSKEGDVRISYIWGYGNTVPVIQGQNIGYTALSGAVQDAINGWTSKPGGVTNLETLLDYVEGMSTSTQKQAWADFMEEFRGQSAITATVPFTALTYKVGVGMTSQTDSNGIAVYYEFDDFNRLKLVRDHEGNIMKTNTYHYKNN